MKKFLLSLLGVTVLCLLGYQAMQEAMRVSALVDEVTIDPGFQGVPGPTYDAVSDEDYIYVSGSTADEENGIVLRFDKETKTLDESFTPDLGDEQYNEAYEIIVHDGYLYLIGNALEVDGNSSGVIRVDLATGVTDVSFNPGINSAYRGAIHNGWLYVGGASELYDLGEGNFIDNLVRIDLETGLVDESFDAGILGEAYDVEVIGDYLYFASYDAIYDLGEDNYLLGIVRIDLDSGMVDTDFQVEGFSEEPNVGIVKPYGESILILGEFAIDIGEGNFIEGAALLDVETGAPDLDFQIDVGSWVETVVILDDYIYLGIYEPVLGGESGVGYLGRVSVSTLELDTEFDLELDDYPRNLLYDEDTFFLGGKFSEVNGVESPFFAAFTIDDTPEPSSEPESNSGSGSSSSKKSSSHKPKNCTAQLPGSTPELYRVDRNGAEATLWITPGGNPYSGFIIWYGTGERTDEYADTFEYRNAEGMVMRTIGALDPNDTYSFRVQSRNDCAYSGSSNTLTIGGGNSSLTVGGPGRNTVRKTTVVGNRPAPSPQASPEVDAIPAEPQPKSSPIPVNDHVENTSSPEPITEQQPQGFWGWMKSWFGL